MVLRIAHYEPQQFGNGFTIIDTGRERLDTSRVIAAAHHKGWMLALGHNGYYGPSVARVLAPMRTALGFSHPLTDQDLERLKAWFEEEIPKLPRY